MSIKVVLFDLDGVLVDACEWHYEALNRALLDVAGLEISREDHLETYNGLPTKVKLGMLRDQGLVREDQEEDIYRLKQENTVDAISAFAETDISKVEMFEALRDAGIKAACVTNSIRETAEKALKTSGLFDFLEFIVTNEDVRSPKPHPEGYI